MTTDDIQLVLVAAVARNGAIGRDGALPWRIPGDLKRFKSLTMGHPVLMGRRTFDSIGKPLPGRANFVVSRRSDFRPAGVSVCGTIPRAVAAARERALADGVGAVMVIGGGEIYAALLSQAWRIELTAVRLNVPGDAWFPELAPGAWRRIPRTATPDQNGIPGHDVVTLIRAGDSSRDDAC